MCSSDLKRVILDGRGGRVKDGRRGARARVSVGAVWHDSGLEGKQGLPAGDDREKCGGQERGENQPTKGYPVWGSADAGEVLQELDELDADAEIPGPDFTHPYDPGAPAGGLAGAGPGQHEADDCSRQQQVG